MLTVDISIILVNYYSETHTLRCLESIALRTASSAHEIIVIDNNSNLDASMLRTKWPNVKVILSDRNLGYGAACDAAAREASGHYLFWRNPIFS